MFSLTSQVMQDKLLPVFLVGFQRSGTNMTVWALDKSSKINLFNENDDKAFVKFKLRELDVICKLLESEKEKGQKIALFKPISDTPKTLYWLEKLPELKILFCYRNFYDVVNSHGVAFGDKGANVLRNCLKNVQDKSTSVLIKLYGEREDFLSLELVRKYYHDNLDNNSIFALSWLFMNHLYFDLNLNDNTRVLPLCYETTVEDPKRSFAEICSFIGIKYQDHLIQDIHAKSVNKESQPLIDKNIEYECRLLYDKLIQGTDTKYLALNNKLNRLKRMFKW